MESATRLQNGAAGNQLRGSEFASKTTSARFYYAVPRSSAGRLEAADVVVEPGLSLLATELRVSSRLVKVVLGSATDGAKAKVTCCLRTSSGIVKEAEFIVAGKDV